MEVVAPSELPTTIEVSSADILGMVWTGGNIRRVS
jgi:hypothetical protein